MTYEDRQSYRQQRAALEELARRLSEADPELPLSTADGLEIVRLLESLAERISPERWDRALEAVASEAARRAEVLAARRG